MKVWILRHGDRWDIAYPEWRNTAEVPYDAPLTPVGHKQAERVADLLYHWGDRVDHVLCSPYLRTIQTAEKVAMRLGRPLKVEHSICETNPRPVAHVRERARYFPCIDVLYEPVFVPQSPEPFPHGLLDRCQKAVRMLIDRFDGENVVMVTHAATSLLMATALLSNEDRPLTLDDTHSVNPIGPCGVFCLQRDEADEQRWRLLHNAHAEHVADLPSETRAWHPLTGLHP